MGTEDGYCPARRAVVTDIGDLVRLRALMLQAMGDPESSLGSSWKELTTAWFEQRLTSAADFAVFVVDDAEGRVVAAAAGLCESRAPSGTNSNGRVGRIFNVVTEPHHRRQGLGRKCTASLLEWFNRQTDVGVVELIATAEGDSLYRALGFQPSQDPILRLTPAR